MPQPMQAIIQPDGVLWGTILCDAATANLIKDMVFPGCTWMDVTNATPVPGPGWTWNPDRVPPFRPPSPDPSWVWDYTTGSWAPPTGEASTGDTSSTGSDGADAGDVPA